jgi:hypothetical protein
MRRCSYPLQWPPNTKRTKPAERQRSRFGSRGQGQLSPYEAAKQVIAELHRLHASFVTITTMLPTRHDGLPYSDGRSEDPGVAVWFTHHGRERCLACDAWTTHGENLRAIALSIEAMRGLERWGVAEVVERTFAGFAALPAAGGGEEAPQEPPPKKLPWRDVIGGHWPDLPPEDLLAIAKRRHRARITQHHPDRGGDTATAAELNAALAEAEAELGGRDA